jgi:hypothetical protein
MTSKKSVQLLAGTLLLLFAFRASAEEKSSTVTLPVDVYKEYLELKKRPAVTLIDEVAVSGKLADGHLNLKAHGQMSGNSPAVEFLDLPETTRLRQCEGSALIYKADKGYVLLAKAEKFSVSCDLAFRQVESLTLQFSKNVLDVRSAISDASVVEQPAGTGQIHLAITRRSPSVARSNVEGKVTFTPRYRITVTSDQVRFNYNLAFDNPNSQTKPFTVKLVNGELVGQIQTNVANESNEKEITLQLRPGSSQVTIVGQLPKNHFQPLFDTEEQYLLLEFHPLVALKLTKEPPRIGVEQSGMAPSYQAAMAFLAGKGKRLEWESKVREVFTSESFAAQSANYLVYLPRRGESIVDASWQLQNQGKPSLQFTLPGKAFFASSNGTPQVLAKTDANELFLPMGTGSTALRLQYDPAKKLPRILGIWRTDLVKPPVTLPTANVAVRLASRHNVLAAFLLGRSILPWFDASKTTWALLIAVAWGFALWGLGVRRKPMVISSSAGLFFTSLSWSGAIFWSVTALAAAYVIRYRKEIVGWFDGVTSRIWKAFFLASAALGAIILLFMMMTATLSSKRMASSEQIMGSAVQKYDMGMADKALPRNSPVTVLEEESREETYLGLPVERVIPTEGENLWLNETSVPDASPLRLRLLLVSDPAAWFFYFVTFLAWLAPVGIHRGVLAKSIWRR